MRMSVWKRVMVVAACVGVCVASVVGLMSVRSFAEKSAGDGASETDPLVTYVPSVGHAVDVENGTVVDSVDDIPAKYQTVANYVYDQLAYGLQPDATTTAPPANAKHETSDDGDYEIDVIRYSTTASDGAADNANDGSDASASSDTSDDAVSNTADLGVDAKSADEPDDGNGNVTWSVVRRRSDSRIIAVMAGDCSE